MNENLCFCFNKVYYYRDLTILWNMNVGMMITYNKLHIEEIIATDDYDDDNIE